MFTRLLNLLAMILIGAAASLQAHTEVSSQGTYLGTHLIEKIIINRAYCVKGIQGDKIFLNPEKVVATDPCQYL